MKIVIDAGHGGRWRPNPPRGDPGAVSPDGQKLESHYTFLYANFLSSFLNKEGFETELTRDHDEYTIDNVLRTKTVGEEDLFISIHFDTYLPGGRRMIYYSGLKNEPKSKKLATILDSHLMTGNIQPSTNSRFGRLYIDDSKGPAVLIEVDKITDADDSTKAMSDFSSKVLNGINEYLGKFSTPFQRVFIIENGQTKQLINIEKMSIIGDKLYIKL